MEELFAVREKKLVPRPGVDEGTVKWIQEETVTFKRIRRSPNIKEKQISGAELYKRKGSYKPTKVVTSPDSQDDQEAAMKSKGAEVIQRVVYLSNGEKLPIN